MTRNVTIHLAAPLESAKVVGPPGAAAPPSAPIPSPQALVEAELHALRLARGALEEGLRQVSELQARTIHQAREQVLDLALDIARKVLMQEIQAGRYEIDPIVQQALLLVPSRQDVTVRLNPRDCDRCTPARQAEDAPNAEGGSGVRFVADPSVPPGGCVLETSEGVVESNLTDHLHEIAEGLARAD